MSKTLSVTQLKALDMMMSTTMSQVSVAEAVGVAPETISRWLSTDMIFAAAMNEARTSRLLETTRKAELLASDALMVIADLMQDQTLSPRLRIEAAMKMVAYGKIGAEPLDYIGPVEPDKLKAHRDLIEYSVGNKLANSG